MNPRDPNVQLVEQVARSLDELCNELLFVGGCAAGLLCTSTSAAPAFLATKPDAFATRGKSDLMASHDFEDIINVLDGRPEIVEEAPLAGEELTNYLATGFSDIVQHPDFENTLPGLVEFDELYEERVSRIRDRINAIIKLGAI